MRYDPSNTNTSFAIVNVAWEETSDSGTQYELHPAPSSEADVDGYSGLKSWIDLFRRESPRISEEKLS